MITLYLLTKLTVAVFKICFWIVAFPIKVMLQMCIVPFQIMFLPFKMLGKLFGID